MSLTNYAKILEEVIEERMKDELLTVDVFGEPHKFLLGEDKMEKAVISAIESHAEKSTISHDLAALLPAEFLNWLNNHGVEYYVTGKTMVICGNLQKLYEECPQSCWDESVFQQAEKENWGQPVEEEPKTETYRCKLTRSLFEDLPSDFQQYLTSHFVHGFMCEYVWFNCDLSQAFDDYGQFSKGTRGTDYIVPSSCFVALAECNWGRQTKENSIIFVEIQLKPPTYTAKYRLQNGDEIEMPGPVGEGWAREKVSWSDSPWDEKSLLTSEIINHLDPEVWFNDYRDVITENIALYKWTWKPLPVEGYPSVDKLKEIQSCASLNPPCECWPDGSRPGGPLR